MNSVEIYIVVEGQTEQTFVRDVLAPEMGYKGIYMYPALIGKPGQKGGDIRFERAKVDIGNFLKQRLNIHISTMFDYYRLEADWPGNVKTSGSAIEKAARVEEATSAKIKKLFPDIMLMDALFLILKCMNLRRCCLVMRPYLQVNSTLIHLT
jgi:hypothetical protein